MKILFVALFVLVTQPFCFGAEHATEHKMIACRLPHPSREWFITIDEADYTSTDELKKAIAHFPAGSKLIWYVGCFWFLEIPTPPRMKLDEFKRFLSERGVTLTFHYDGAW